MILTFAMSAYSAVVHFAGVISARRRHDTVV